MLISAVKSALRDRARQYQIRDLLFELQQDIAEREAYELRLKEASAASLEAQMVGQSDLTFVFRRTFGSSIDSRQLSGLKVLLVEDSPDNRALIRIILSKAGATIETALDGEAGVAEAMTGRYSVVLMDIQMPKMDGLEATRLLRANGYVGPTVALTAHAMHEERDRCMQAGFTHFLPRPIEKSALLGLLATLEKSDSAQKSVVDLQNQRV